MIVAKKNVNTLDALADAVSSLCERIPASDIPLLIIDDEFDEEDLQYSKIDDSNYVFEGKTALVDMYRVLEIDGGNFESVKGESDTLAGFVVEQSGKIPLKGEKISFENYTFTIESADKRKVKRVKVTIKDELEKE